MWKRSVLGLFFFVGFNGLRQVCRDHGVCKVISFVGFVAFVGFSGFVFFIRFLEVVKVAKFL